MVPGDGTTETCRPLSGKISDDCKRFIRETKLRRDSQHGVENATVCTLRLWTVMTGKPRGIPEDFKCSGRSRTSNRKHSRPSISNYVWRKERQRKRVMRYANRCGRPLFRDGMRRKLSAKPHYLLMHSLIYPDFFKRVRRNCRSTPYVIIWLRLFRFRTSKRCIISMSISTATYRKSRPVG